jgi:hypothetical protein
VPSCRPTRDERPLLDRVLDTPRLAQVVPRLPPEVLHRVIQSCGLEDCGDLVAFATPAQLACVLDLDLWRAARPGLDEQFDADRFGVWLEVLVGCSAAVAAQKLVEMDGDLVVAGFARHVRVYDVAAVTPLMSSDGEEFVGVRPSDDGPSCDVGGYRVAARRTDAWDAIVAVLIALAAEHPDYFHDAMRRCRRLSNSTPEIDGLHDLLSEEEQVMLDVALNREGRRERQGYVTAAQARAFLHMSRALRLGRDGTVPPPNPIARAYFEPVGSATAVETSSGRRRLQAASGTAPAGDDTGDAGVAAFVDVLRDAGVLEPQTRALLEGHEEDSRHARMRGHMQFARARDQGAYSMRTAELAYLANALISGCSIQARPFTAREASDAAVAVCNLGLENWLAGSALPDDFLVSHDVIGVFQVGWTVLHDDVSMYAADQLIAVLTDLRCGDREIQSGLDALRVEMTKYLRVGAPWRARDALDVIAILDMPAWAALLGLIDECPVIHAAMRTSLHSRTPAVSANAFEFISENSQIASVREFIHCLPETLRR